MFLAFLWGYNSLAVRWLELVAHCVSLVVNLSCAWKCLFLCKSGSRVPAWFRGAPFGTCVRASALCLPCAGSVIVYVWRLRAVLNAVSVAEHSLAACSRMVVVCKSRAELIGDLAFGLPPESCLPLGVMVTGLFLNWRSRSCLWLLTRVWLSGDKFLEDRVSFDDKMFFVVLSCPECCKRECICVSTVSWCVGSKLQSAGSFWTALRWDVSFNNISPCFTVFHVQDR